MGETASSYYSAFLSYAPLDWAKAREICDILDDLGFRCLMAPRKLRGGVVAELYRAIEDAGAFVLVVSKATETSQPAREEMRAALQRRKPVFAFFVERPDAESALGPYLPRMRRIDAWSGRLADHVVQLSRNLPTGRSSPIKRSRTFEAPGWARLALSMPGILCELAFSGLMLWALNRLLQGGLR